MTDATGKTMGMEELERALGGALQMNRDVNLPTHRRALALALITELCHDNLPTILAALSDAARVRESEARAEELLRAEWGGAYDKNVAMAARAARHFGGQRLIDWLNRTENGNSPELIRAFFTAYSALTQPEGCKP